METLRVSDGGVWAGLGFGNCLRNDMMLLGMPCSQGAHPEASTKLDTFEKSLNRVPSAKCAAT